MADVLKIDSNATGLAYAVEETYGVLPVTPTWRPAEPNSYSDFGGNNVLVARRPISADRQLQKGVVTDLDASGGFQQDLTQENAVDLLEGFFFASVRDKAELAVATVDGTGEDFEPASGGDAYFANDLLFAQGFDDAENNGLHLVTGVPAAASVPVTSDLTTAATQTGTIRRVGHQFATGDAEIDATGALPQLITSTKVLTDLGLIPGEWIWIGGDLAAEQFATAANRGFARVRSVATNAIVLDKTDQDFVTDDGATKTIRIFWASRVLKNEDSTLSVRRTFQLERSLGAPDDAEPAEIQGEYLVGAVPNEWTINVPTADKVTCDYSFVAKTTEHRDGPTGLKTGNRPALVAADAFNTSSDYTRINLSVVDAADSAPDPLFAFVQDFSITINNGATALKAVSFLGGFEVTTGPFEVTGSLNAYFTKTSALQSVIDNADVTFDAHLVKENKGISLDLPLVALGGGRLNVEQDAAVIVPLELAAANGSQVDEALDHTLLVGWWDYLPDLAE